MPEAVVTDEEQELLPEDTLFRGVLTDVTERQQSWDDKYTGQRETATKWVWHFRVTDGQYAGKNAKGETFAKVRTGDQAFDWITALAGVEPAVGQNINTDNYKGSFCMFEVSHRSFNGRKGEVTIAEVSQVYEDRGGSDQPPF